MGWVTVIVNAVMAIIKAIFGTDKPLENIVTHPKPTLEADDGKTDKEHLEDLGL